MIINPEIEHYCREHSDKHSGLLQYIERQTHIRSTQPNMLSGEYQGRILAMISHMIKPRRILEVGTFTGYATLCMAEGLDPEGLIETIELDRERELFLRKVFAKSDYEKQIKLLIGKAIDLLPSIENGINLAFIDADKQNYAKYYDLILPKLVDGGIIIADNVLWKGRILESAKDKKTKAIAGFNTKVLADKRVEKILFPVRDGLYLIRKK